jgi:hypothetical protein
MRERAREGARINHAARACETNQGAHQMSESSNKSSAALILFAWLLVGLPLGWGVYNTLLSSMKLFQAPAAAATLPAK